jgi:hypothetical protein
VLSGRAAGAPRAPSPLWAITAIRPAPRNFASSRASRIAAYESGEPSTATTTVIAHLFMAETCRSVRSAGPGRSKGRDGRPAQAAHAALSSCSSPVVGCHATSWNMVLSVLALKLILIVVPPI